MNSRLTALGIALTLLATAASAQVAEPPKSLQQCIEIALANQVDVLVGRNQVEAARARETQQRSDYLPQVSVGYADALAESGESLRRDGTSVSVTQNFFDGGLREARVRGAGADVWRTRYALERSRQTVIYRVTTDYFNLLRAQRLEGVETARVNYLQEQLAQVQGRVDVGETARVETLPVQAQLANAGVDRIQSENDRQTAAVQLQNSMGITPSPDFTVQDVEGVPTASLLPVDQYIEAAYRSRPEVGEAQADIRSARSGVDIARTYLYPRPTITGQYDRALSGGISALSEDESYSIIGGIAFDIFSGGGRQAALREARSGLSTAGIRAAQTTKDIDAEVRTAYFNAQSSRRRLEASDVSLQAAQANLEAQQERYAQGLAITLDLLNAQSELVQARSQAVQARYDYHISLAQLDYAAGRSGGLNAK